MVRDPNEPLPVPNTPEEYRNGIADDGSPLRIVSKELIPPRVEGEPEIPLAGAGEKPPSRHHLEAEKQLLAARQEHVARVRECVDLLRDTVALGTPAREILAKDAEIALLDREIALELKRRKLEQLKAAPIDAPLPVAPEETEAPAAPVASQEREAAEPNPARTREPRVREPRVREIRFSPAVLLTLALRAARDLPRLSAELLELESKLFPAEADLKLKQDFYLDKGVSVVTDTLVSMDKTFGDLGFAHWMPFRYPDQWLMFGGLLQRVLAAHGLMPSGNAEIYRRLMEETPSISPIAADATPPKSWGLSYRVREIKHMQALIDRIADVRAGRGPPL